MAALVFAVNARLGEANRLACGLGSGVVCKIYSARHGLRCTSRPVRHRVGRCIAPGRSIAGTDQPQQAVLPLPPFSSGTPSLRRMKPSGQTFVNPNCSRFKPTKAVKANAHRLTKIGLCSKAQRKRYEMKEACKNPDVTVDCHD